MTKPINPDKDIHIQVALSAPMGKKLPLTKNNVSPIITKAQSSRMRFRLADPSLFPACSKKSALSVQKRATPMAIVSPLILQQQQTKSHDSHTCNKTYNGKVVLSKTLGTGQQFVNGNKDHNAGNGCHNHTFQLRSPERK